MHNERLFYIQSVNYILFCFFLWHFCQYSGRRLSFKEASLSHSDTVHAVGLLRTRDQKLRPLPDNTLHSQETDVPAIDGIRNPNRSKT